MRPRFSVSLRARVIYHDLAHRLGGDREEMRAIVRPVAALLRELQIGLVQKTCRVQGRRRRRCELTSCELFELFVHARECCFQRRGIAAVRRFE